MIQFTKNSNIISKVYQQDNIASGSCLKMYYCDLKPEMTLNLHIKTINKQFEYILL